MFGQFFTALRPMRSSNTRLLSKRRLLHQEKLELAGKLGDIKHKKINVDWEIENATKKLKDRNNVLSVEVEKYKKDAIRYVELNEELLDRVGILENRILGYLETINTLEKVTGITTKRFSNIDLGEDDPLF